MLVTCMLVPQNPEFMFVIPTLCVEIIHYIDMCTKETQDNEENPTDLDLGSEFQVPQVVHTFHNGRGFRNLMELFFSTLSLDFSSHFGLHSHK